MAAAPIDWSEYLRLAEELGERRGDEAALRTSISRAYYYVYHLALKRAETNNFRAQRGEPSHVQLWRVFSENPDAECRRLGDLGSRLKENRRRADYDTVFVRAADDVPTILSDARDFALRLSRLPARLPNPASQRQ
jgi:uncharacterized protein (UPF0332 family)